MTTPSTPTKLRAMTAYDKVDRFLRNNLGDSDYEDYSAALETVFDFAPVEAQPSAVNVCPDMDAACVEVPAHRRCKNCPTLAAPSAVLPLKGEVGTGEGA